MKCGYCGKDAGALLCGTCRNDLVVLLDKCLDLKGDLDWAAGRKTHAEGERVTGSNVPGIPVNLDVVEVRRGIETALVVAAGVQGWERARRKLIGEVDALASVARGVVLYSELKELVPEALRLVDIPRQTVAVRVPCPSCGGKRLRPRFGGLVCVRCRRFLSVREVRDAVADG